MIGAGLVVAAFLPTLAARRGQQRAVLLWALSIATVATALAAFDVPVWLMALLLAIVNLVAGAGNETTNRLIGWMGKELSDNPDQRRAIVANPKLIPQVIEETLRYQPPGPSVGRYVTRDVEVKGVTIPKGSIALMLVGPANRDEARSVNGDTYDIHREQRPHLGFGFGV